MVRRRYPIGPQRKWVLHGEEGVREDLRLGQMLRPYCCCVDLCLLLLFRSDDEFLILWVFILMKQKGSTSFRVSGWFSRTIGHFLVQFWVLRNIPSRIGGDARDSEENHNTAHTMIVPVILPVDDLPVVTIPGFAVVLERLKRSKTHIFWKRPTCTKIVGLFEEPSCTRAVEVCRIMPRDIARHV